MRTIRRGSFLVILLILVNSCSAKRSPSGKSSANHKNVMTSAVRNSKLKTAYFAEGCFWCAEAIYQRVRGVKNVVSGFSGGTKPNPTYKEVSSETTKYAETVRVRYNPKQVTYRQLVEVFFGSQDPTQKNGQGPDIGESYRSIIFYQNDQEKKIAGEVKKQIEQSGKYSKPLAVEITK
ncbi:MAG TPA: peptide-methionine (S)-S-oxide reductase MsrA, partial [Balneolaceae bacterium]|nr:peptide-methionine (S)-S-oxide reductase MsrA [Balneolaceae bacterium]